MGRKKRSSLGKLRAWPLLLLLAGIYGAREYLGITDVSDVNALSRLALPIALIMLAIAAVWLLVRLIFYPRRQEHLDEKR